MLDGLPPEARRILARRTHRHYAEKGVSDELLHSLLAVAMSASSKSDFQQTSVIVVDNADVRAEIGLQFPAMPWIAKSPRFLVFCGDTLRLEKLGALRGHELVNRDVEGFFNAAVDAALCMQTFILAAEMTGLGCCPISVIRNKAPLVARLLQLPNGVYPVAGLCVGYPAVAGHVSMRLPMAVTVHQDKYREDAMGAEIAAYDARREAVHPTPNSKQRDAARFGLCGNYGWSEDKVRQALEPEGRAFANFLCDTGFDLTWP